MKLHFLGTGHWRSKERNPTCLYLQYQNYNLMFECPASAKALLEANQLPKPDAVFISSTHPHSYDETALREICSPSTEMCIMRGLRIGPLSVQSRLVADSEYKSVGFSVLMNNRTNDRKILVFAPKHDGLPSSLIENTRYLVIENNVGDGLRPVSPSETHRTPVAHRTYIVNLTEDAYPLLEGCNGIIIPKDGEVVNMINSGVYLHRPGLANLVAAGRFPSIVKSASFEDYVGKPIFLCSDEGVHAKIVLSEGESIDRDTFRDATVKHGMLESEALELWPGFKTLHIFDVEVKERYEDPVEYNKPNAYRAFLENVEVDVPEVETETEEENLQEVIRKEDNVIVLYDKDGEKVLGRFPFGEGEKYGTEAAAREAAEKREKQIKMFTHMDEGEGEEGTDEELYEAKWSTEYVNDLSDSAFLYIESGGEENGEGKTKPRSLRHLPVRDHQGNVDLPHLRNAIARLGQSETGKNWEGFTESTRERLQKKAQQLLERVQESQVVFVLSRDGTMRTLQASVREAVIEGQDMSGFFVEEV